MSMLEIILAIISVVVPPFTYFLGRSKMKAEVTKLIAETQEMSDNHEIKLSKFYREQVLELTQDVRTLRAAVEKCDECYETIKQLKESYKDLQNQITIINNKT